MELPFRQKGDELLRPGAMLEMRERFRRHAKTNDLTTVMAYAFDRRTRMLPFVHIDKRMTPAGVRGIGSAFLDAGFPKTRIVLELWNRKFAPSLARLDGRIPDLFLLSSMGIHSERMKELLADVCTMDPAQRPLVIAGGPHAWYMPWDVFGADPRAPGAADLAYFTGLLDSGAHTQASLGVLAAQVDLNTQSVELLGLASTGIEYTPA